MGNRLTRIYTRTGDDGSTGMADGSRVRKDSARIEAIGEVDELNSFIGLLITNALPDDIRLLLQTIQHQLFDLGGELSLPDRAALTMQMVTSLEDEINHYNTDLPPLKEFILPGGCQAGAICHVARAVCRRAERRVVTLSAEESLNPALSTYLNRLSDLLFVLSRVIVRQSGGQEVFWKSEKNRNPI